MVKLNGVYSPTDSIKGFIPQIKTYWIDGHFDVFWNQTTTLYCVKRGIFVPKFAVVKNDQNNDRIYLKKQFAESILVRTKFDSTNRYDMMALSLQNKINVPWEKEVSILPPTSLPEF